jgi:hypothetical protein
MEGVAAHLCDGTFSRNMEKPGMIPACRLLGPKRFETETEIANVKFSAPIHVIYSCAGSACDLKQ